MERALWSYTTVSCAEFVTAVIGEYRFDHCVKMDLHLRRLYR
jgi:hypothetical protein